mmetsp:Transcript_111/g.327  ORF Transcript_111/g.327 Transcript_111/m.327 type:complete len:307 (-) Transcript_111:462-1382(-)
MSLRWPAVGPTVLARCNHIPASVGPDLVPPPCKAYCKHCHRDYTGHRQQQCGPVQGAHFLPAAKNNGDHPATVYAIPQMSVRTETLCKTWTHFYDDTENIGPGHCTRKDRGLAVADFACSQHQKRRFLVDLFDKLHSYTVVPEAELGGPELLETLLCTLNFLKLSILDAYAMTHSKAIVPLPVFGNVQAFRLRRRLPVHSNDHDVAGEESTGAGRVCPPRLITLNGLKVLPAVANGDVLHEKNRQRPILGIVLLVQKEEPGADAREGPIARGKGFHLITRRGAAVVVLPCKITAQVFRLPQSARSL